jgi:hypothetical protein
MLSFFVHETLFKLVGALDLWCLLWRFQFLNFKSALAHKLKVKVLA